MQFMNLPISGAFRIVLALLAGILSPSLTWSGEPANDSSSGQIAMDLERIHKIPPQNQTLQPRAEREEISGIVERLNRGDHEKVASAVVNAIQKANPGREIANYAALLPKVPSVKPDILRRIQSEPNPVLKARLINCVRDVKGTDVVKALIPQLDDKTPADSQQTGPFALRVCDYAFDSIYLHVHHIPDLGLDASTAMSDIIQRDIPIDWRDARIAKLKSGLTKKFGPNLDLPNDL
jgi:hypothetical protein